MVEYNFFNYRGSYTDRHFCPYLTSGLGIFTTAMSKANIAARDRSEVLCISIGAGVEYKLTRTLNLGYEMVARKTFTDNLDATGPLLLGIHESPSLYDTDWYYLNSL